MNNNTEYNNYPNSTPPDYSKIAFDRLVEKTKKNASFPIWLLLCAAVLVTFLSGGTAIFIILAVGGYYYYREYQEVKREQGLNQNPQNHQ